MSLSQARPFEKYFQNAKSNVHQWLPIALVLSLASIVFFYHIDGEGLWLDELTSIRDAEELPGKLMSSLVRPLYYILLLGWMQFGDSDAWLRSLSVSFAIAAVFLLYRLGHRLLGKAEGLIAATMLTLSPMFINHAQEVRMYALSTCLGVAGTLFLVQALTEENADEPSHGTLAKWCIFRLMAILTVPLNVVLLLPDVLIYWWRFRQQRSALIRFGGWLGLLILLWLPCVFSVLRETSPDSTYASHHTGRQPPGLDNLIRTLKFWTVWPFAVQTNAIAASFYKVFTLLVAGLLGAALLRKHRSPNILWAMAWFVLPLVPILGFSYISVPIWVNRYLLFVSPYLFLILAAGIIRLWRQWKVAALVIALVYLIAVGGGLVRYYTVQDRPDYKFIVETIEQNEQPGDAVVWSLFVQKIILSHYYDGSAEFFHNKLRGVKTDADISAWLNNFPENVPGQLWLVLKVGDKEYPRFEQQIKTKYTIDKTLDYEQGSKVLLLSQR